MLLLIESTWVPLIPHLINPCRHVTLNKLQSALTQFQLKGDHACWWLSLHLDSILLIFLYGLTKTWLFPRIEEYSLPAFELQCWESLSLFFIKTLQLLQNGLRHRAGRSHIHHSLPPLHLPLVGRSCFQGTMSQSQGPPQSTVCIFTKLNGLRSHNSTRNVHRTTRFISLGWWSASSSCSLKCDSLYSYMCNTLLLIPDFWKVLKCNFFYTIAQERLFCSKSFHQCQESSNWFNRRSYKSFFEIFITQ